MTYTKRMNIGANIRTTRIKMGLSQEKLSRMCGFSNTTLSSYETGKRNPGLETVACVAKQLHVNIEQLLYGDSSISFLSSEQNEGRKIVNAIYFLWEQKILKYQNSRVGMILSADQYDETQYFPLLIMKYQLPIKRLLCSLDEFEDKKNTYMEPDKYIEILKESVATEINNEIKNDNY